MILNQSPPLLVSTDLACTHFYISYIAVLHTNGLESLSKVLSATYISPSKLLKGVDLHSDSLNHWLHLLQSLIFSLLSLASYLRLRKTFLNLFTWPTSDSGVCTTSLLLKTQTEFSLLWVSVCWHDIFFRFIILAVKSSTCNWNNFFSLWNSFHHHWHEQFTACFGKWGAGGSCMHKPWKLLIFLSIFAGIHPLLGFLRH